jgi:hypothetical protein
MALAGRGVDVSLDVAASSDRQKLKRRKAKRTNPRITVTRKVRLSVVLLVKFPALVPHSSNVPATPSHRLS